jgi:hypothetical protein
LFRKFTINAHILQFYILVFNINNPQDLNNMVWMNNAANSGLPTISSVTSGGQNPMIIDENSISYFNTQQANQANLAQQQAALMVIFSALFICSTYT